jgi:hypothetical protein
VSSQHLANALVLTTALLLAPVAHAQRAGGGDQRIELDVGEQETVSAANVASYSVGSEGIADVRLTSDGRTFVIVGQQSGETSLLLIYADGHQVTTSGSICTSCSSPRPTITRSASPGRAASAAARSSM